MFAAYYCAGKASAKDMAAINKLRESCFVVVRDANDFAYSEKGRMTFNCDKAYFPADFPVIGEAYGARGVDAEAHDKKPARKAKAKPKAE